MISITIYIMEKGGGDGKLLQGTSQGSALRKANNI